MVAYGSWLKENPHEFFRTPPEATLALLRKEKLAGPIWECACGDGAISRLLHGEVLSSDLVDYGFGIAGVDFLETTLRVPTVITNPPYSKKLEFVLHALECATSKVAMLLELRFWQRRAYKPLFDCLPPRTVYGLRRPLRFGNRRAWLWPHAWFVWEIGWHGKTILEWLDN
jgi:hypothetical protein